MVAAKLANMRSGERTDLSSIDLRSVSQPQAAALLNVSRPTVQRAKKVITDGIPELQDMVTGGQAPTIQDPASLVRISEIVGRAGIGLAQGFLRIGLVLPVGGGECPVANRHQKHEDQHPTPPDYQPAGRIAPCRNRNLLTRRFIWGLGQSSRR